jgi:DNA sulfur modification protein DndE
MRLNKILLSKDASERLKHLKARTGLAPNILSRLGFTLSLADPSVPNPAQFAEEEREFNRYTLLGEWDDLYVALLKQRLADDKLPDDAVEKQFRAHLNRGILSLYGLVKSVADIARLCEKASAAAENAGGGNGKPRRKK